MTSSRSKRCRECQQTKDITFFKIDRTRNDGHANQCSSCKAKIWKAKREMKFRG